MPEFTPTERAALHADLDALVARAQSQPGANAPAAFSNALSDVIAESFEIFAKHVLIAAERAVSERVAEMEQTVRENKESNRRHGEHLRRHETKIQALSLHKADK